MVFNCSCDICCSTQNCIIITACNSEATEQDYSNLAELHKKTVGSAFLAGEVEAEWRKGDMSFRFKCVDDRVQFTSGRGRELPPPTFIQTALICSRSMWKTPMQVSGFECRLKYVGIPAPTLHSMGWPSVRLALSAGSTDKHPHTTP